MQFRRPMKSTVVHLDQPADAAELLTPPSVTVPSILDEAAAAVSGQPLELVTNHAAHGVPVSKMFDEAVRMQEKCRDYSVPCSPEKLRAHFDPDTNLFHFLPQDGALQKMPMSRYSFSQLCTKLGVPMRYVEKCIKDGRSDLAAENVNAWLEDYDKTLFVRAYDETVRGVLSDSYMVMDAPDILSVMNEALSTDDRFVVRGHYLSPERLHARIISREMLPIPGEDLFAGFQLDSSDVGRSTLSLKFLLFKQVCTNGATITRGEFNLLHRRHIGNSLIDLRADFAAAIEKVPELVETTTGIIKHALVAPSPILRTGEDWSSVVDEERVRRLNTWYKFSENEAKAIVEIVNGKKYKQNSRWGLVNSITEASQRYTLERRLDMEKIAGDILLGSAA